MASQRPTPAIVARARASGRRQAKPVARWAPKEFPTRPRAVGCGGGRSGKSSKARWWWKRSSRDSSCLQRRRAGEDEEVAGRVAEAGARGGALGENPVRLGGATLLVGLEGDGPAHPDDERCRLGAGGGVAVEVGEGVETEDGAGDCELHGWEVIAGWLERRLSLGGLLSGREADGSLERSEGTHSGLGRGRAGGPPSCPQYVPHWRSCPSKVCPSFALTFISDFATQSPIAR